MSDNFPAPSINIKIGGKPHEVTMYFGHLNELAELVGSYERLPEVDFDARTRTAVLATLLAPRDERGRHADPEWFIPPDLSIEDGEAVLDFAKEHLADFLLGRLIKQLRLIETNAPKLTEAGASLGGLVR